MGSKLIAEANEHIRQLFDSATARAVCTVKAELTLLYWQIGRRIHQDILGARRAGYGEEIVSALGRQLTAAYVRGFSSQNLRHMINFAEIFDDEPKASALRRQLSWTCLKTLKDMEMERPKRVVQPPDRLLPAQVVEASECVSLVFAFWMPPTCI